jgi:peptidoglycan/xylan/chitin deacetylase (PgdA/CDA1 family)
MLIVNCRKVGLAVCRVVIWALMLFPWIFIFLCGCVIDECISKHVMMRRLFWNYLSIIFPDLITLSSLLVNTYGKCIYRYDDDKKENRIVLSIDDCPGDSPIEMKLLLDCLKKHNAKATFFCTTDFISKGGIETKRIMRMILSDGHELGNHMPEDKPYWGMSAQQFEQELERSEDVLMRLDKRAVKDRWFRPPMGKLSNAMMSVLDRKGYRGVVLGDVFSNDPFIGGNIDPPCETVIKYHVSHNMRRARPGSIVIFHCPNLCRRRQLVPILDDLLAQWTQNSHIQCCTLSDFNDHKK